MLGPKCLQSQSDDNAIDVMQLMSPRVPPPLPAGRSKNKDFWLDVESTSAETCHYGLVEGKRLREERERLLSILPGEVEGEEEEKELEEEAAAREEEEALRGGLLSSLLGGWWLGGRGCGDMMGEDKDSWKAGWAAPAGNSSTAAGGGATKGDGKGDSSVPLMCRKRHKEQPPDPLALRAWAMNNSVVPPVQGREYLALCTVTRGMLSRKRCSFFNKSLL